MLPVIANIAEAIQKAFNPSPAHTIPWKTASEKKSELCIIIINKNIFFRNADVISIVVIPTNE